MNTGKTTDFEPVSDRFWKTIALVGGSATGLIVLGNLVLTVANGPERIRNLEIQKDQMEQRIRQLEVTIPKIDATLEVMRRQVERIEQKIDSLKE